MEEGGKGREVMEEGRRGREGGGREGREGGGREGGREEGERGGGMEEGGEGEMEEGGGRERWKREGEGEMGGLVVARVHCWCWPSFMRVRFRARAVAVNGRSCCRPWAPDVRGWVVVVRGRSMFMGGVSWSSTEGRPWALDACGWGVVAVNRGVGCVVSRLWGSRSSVVRSWRSSGRVVVRGVVVVCGAGRSRMGRGRQWGGRPWALDICRWVAVVYGGVVRVVCRLWAVVVVHGGVVFISVGAVAVVCRRSWLSACVRSWSWSFVGARGRVWGLDHPCGLSSSNRGVVVGDGSAVVVVPRRPGVWAFVARKVAVVVART